MIPAWSVDDLAELRRVSRELGARFDLDACARAVRRRRLDVNLALDALIGRTPEEAHAALGEAFPAPALRPNALGRVVRRLFG